MWNKLEDGLLNKKYLPVDITVTLYQHRPATLETEMFGVLGKYADTNYKDDWSDDATLGIIHFKPHGGSPGVYRSLKRKRSPCLADVSLNGNVKNNLWGGSPAVAAAARCPSVFSQCLNILFKVAVQSDFSLSFVYGCRDFFAVLVDKIDGELYKLFPPNLQHLVYILTLPITASLGHEYLETFAESDVVENALMEALKAGNEAIPIVRSLLCFFPYWLPILRKNGFLHKHLQEGWYEV